MTTPSAEQIAALASYAQRNGRQWKSRLRRAWEHGQDEREPEGARLRQLRNSFGPEWLARANLMQLQPTQEKTT